MPRPLKLFVWSNPNRRECPPAPNRSRCTSDFVAAASKASAKRCFEQFSAWIRVPLSEIRESSAKAVHDVVISEPGVVFWRPVDEYETELTRAMPPSRIAKVTNQIMDQFGECYSKLANGENSQA
jgi:hypothetical protein